MNYKISVIMPVYNAQDTLEEAVDSIINQSIGFENIELILVDDVSTDNTRQIIEKYSNEYDNIISFFSKENSGTPSKPRNIGIDLASADYLMFIDNDDAYDEEFCKKVYEKIKDDKFDAVACGYFEIDYSKNLKRLHCEKKPIFNKEDLLKLPESVIWNKIYKKSIVKENNIYFKEVINEDSLFLLEYLLNSDSLLYLTDFAGYMHIYRNSSLSITTYENTMNYIGSYYMIYDLLDKYGATDLISFKGRVLMTLERCLVFKGNKNQMQNVLKKLLEFERFIDFHETLDNKILNFVNNLLIGDHLAAATYVMLILNKMCQSNFVKKVVRKVYY